MIAAPVQYKIRWETPPDNFLPGNGHSLGKQSRRRLSRAVAMAKRDPLLEVA
uniref:hypothetical protein n=1 Tax=Photorhabdus sp. RM322S TaxID=3342825 RepID=UPI0036D7A6FB